jgi:iron(III) transport system ATP-binding protein
MTENLSGGESSLKNPYLRITQLTKRFGEFVALDDISLEIHEGEFVCFLGPSGCGKTTLLRAIAGLDIQTSGTVEQSGQDISALPPAERDFGIVFQSYALFPNLTVRRNIAYGLENRKLKRSEIDARVTELLDTVGLPDQGNKYPAQLSGGQQQRVALARALATSPGLLLLDEPLSALDAKVRVRLRHEIKGLQQQLGLTTIMVTHDQEEALAMADRIVVMDRGAIAQVGSPLAIYRDPTSAFVADFIGTMNFAPGTMVAPGQVRYGQLNLKCRSNGFGEGQPVTVAIRPEDIVFNNVNGTEDNSLEVNVDEMEFLGSFVRATLGSPVLEDRHLQADMSINLVRRMRIEQGAQIPVILPEDRIRVYPGDGHRG